MLLSPCAFLTDEPLKIDYLASYSLKTPIYKKELGNSF